MGMMKIMSKRGRELVSFVVAGCQRQEMYRRPSDYLGLTDEMKKYRHQKEKKDSVEHHQKLISWTERKKRKNGGAPALKAGVFLAPVIQPTTTKTIPADPH